MDLIVILIWLGTMLIYYLFRLAFLNENFFKDKGVPYEKPLPIFGSVLKFVMGKRNMNLILSDLYKKYDGLRFFGMFNMRRPFYILRDPDLIKDITITNFEHFIDHASVVHEKLDPILSNILLFMRGQTWKDMRSLLTPIFTSSKLKMLFNVLSDNAVDFSNYVEEELKDKERVFMYTKDIFSRFTMNGIARSVFSMDADFVRNDKDDVTFHMRNCLRIDLFSSPRIFILNFFPWLYEKLGMRQFNKNVVDFAKTISTDAVKYREDNNIVVKDVLQVLIDIKRGTLKHTEEEKDYGFFNSHVSYFKNNKRENNFTNEEIMAQGFVFFIAGFETTTNLLQMCAYELAKNPDIQDTLIQEMDEIRDNLKGEPVTYEICNNEMKYADMVIMETMRLWPPSPHAGNRKCTKTYAFTNTDGKTVKINPGDNIYYPVVALHYDEKYWPNPKKFDPFRFSEEKRHNIHPATYLPFGIGPRSCIWSRFGLIEVKLLFYHLLKDYKFALCEETPKKIEFECYFTAHLKTPMVVELVRRE